MTFVVPIEGLNPDLKTRRVSSVLDRSSSDHHSSALGSSHETTRRSVSSEIVRARPLSTGTSMC